MPLWYYGILLLNKEESSLSSILNLATDELKKNVVILWFNN